MVSLTLMCSLQKGAQLNPNGTFMCLTIMTALTNTYCDRQCRLVMFVNSVAKRCIADLQLQ